MSVESDGWAGIDELLQSPGYPSEERFEEGPVAVIECLQEIPCNPCETACKAGAIEVGEPITRIPILHAECCTGCGLCIPGCPGQAIFVIHKNWSDRWASISLPFEMLPLPEKGATVPAVDRAGNVVCPAKVIHVSLAKRNDRTAVVTISIPKEAIHLVRGIGRGAKDG
jgi:Fe-S-cluster-containing hydrogenase component 2